MTFAKPSSARGRTVRTARRLAPLACLGLVAAASLIVAPGMMPGPAPAAFFLTGSDRAGPPAGLIEASMPSPTPLGLAPDAVEAEQARLINAEIPIRPSSLEAARPFDLPVGGEQRARAVSCLTQAVYYEAGFEPIQGQRAVAQVVLNRLRHPAFPKSVCGVVFQGAQQRICQFSFTCDGSLGRPPAPGAWIRSRLVAEAALDGRVEAGVGQATHYHADYVFPAWGRELDKVARIGTHIFYRWPGSFGRKTAFVGRYAGAEPMLGAGRTAVVQAGAGMAGAGPVGPRAPNDLGGLIEPGRGWTPSVPVPDQNGSAFARTLASHQASPGVAPTS